LRFQPRARGRRHHRHLDPVRRAQGRRAGDDPLSTEALARFQADIDAIGELFVATVARNRGLGPAAVRGTEATTFLGASGVKAGFAEP